MSQGTITHFLVAGACLFAFVLSGCETSDESKTKKTTKEEKDLLEGGTTKDDIDLMRDTARLFWDKTEYARAASQYEKILELAPEDKEATLGLGLCYAQIGDTNPELFDRGAELLRKYVDSMAAPGDARGLLGLGILYFRQGAAAGKEVDTLIARRIELEDAMRSNSERLLSSASANEKRRVAKESDRLSQAVAEAERKVVVAEKLREDKLAEAVRYQTMTMEANPLDVLPYKLRAETNSLRGPEHYQQAIDDLDTYLDLTVNHTRERVESALATGLDEKGNEIPQETAMQTMGRLDKLEALLLEMRASLLRRTGQHEEAITDLQRVLHLQPDRASAYAEIASTMEDMGNYLDAISYLEQYIEALPTGAIDAKARARIRIEDLNKKAEARNVE